MAQKVLKPSANRVRPLVPLKAVATGFQSTTASAHVSRGGLSAAERLDPPDMALIEGMAAGDTEALRRLSQRYGRAVLFAAERILRNGADAEEIATDVLWQAWRQAASFDSARGSVSGWLMLLVRSRAIDRLRTSNARRVAPEEGSIGEHEPDPMFGIYSIERQKIVKEAVAALQENERTLLELAYFSDLPQSEIARQLGIPLGTIKTRMRGALIKLRAALAHSGVKTGSI